MSLACCCSLCIVRCLVFDIAVCCVLFVVSCLSFVVGCNLFVVHCCLFIYWFVVVLRGLVFSRLRFGVRCLVVGV